MPQDTSPGTKTSTSALRSYVRMSNRHSKVAVLLFGLGSLCDEEDRLGEINEITSAFRHSLTTVSDLRPLRPSWGTTETVKAIPGTDNWGSMVLKGCKEDGSIPEKIKQIYSKNTQACTKNNAAAVTAKNFSDIEIGDFETLWLFPWNAQEGEEKRSLPKVRIMSQEALWGSPFARSSVTQTIWKNGGNDGWTCHEMALKQRLSTVEKRRCFAVECTEREEDWPLIDNFRSHLGKKHVAGHQAKAMNLGSRSSLVWPENRINTKRGCHSSNNRFSVLDRVFEVLWAEATGMLINETINESTSRSGILDKPIITCNNGMMIVHAGHGNCAATAGSTDERQEHAGNDLMQSLVDDSKRPQPRPPMMSPDDDDDDETIGFQRAACSQPRTAPTTMPLRAWHACGHRKWNCISCHHQKCTNCAHRICTCCRSIAFRQNSGAQKHGFAALGSASMNHIPHRRLHLQSPSIVHQWRAVIAQTCGRVAFATTIDRIDCPQTSIAVAG